MASTAASAYNYRDHLQVLNGFLAKADSKDKLTALIQYACMFLSAGEPGNIKKIQTSVTAARKVFRVMRPLECLVPVLNQPGFTGKQPKLLEAINKLKAILMAIYFGADHLVWAHQIGLANNKTSQERWQKLSLYSWALGSVCTVVSEVWSITSLSVVKKEGESDEEYKKRVDDARAQINQRMFVLVHGLVQAALAAGLLQLAPLKPRTVGFLGVVASAMNCYMLYPSYPKLAAPAKAKAA
mmetsp:Transcript_14982/g.32478  ORF Transcript_14982/g.32478 Transcript_14982/m.32478 type:complete len:241 (+) Transcript_14982:194-916(+)|eukprot:CAMPEP_0202901226 /NCGR_PEP_ID=MMETSP1392-20130828/14113_1 /ASSEMBLY_ACC=CAM_ASM_000868 /TAXON_ID=225041 /ORGANISM="Chlamydomonas chlamydogama, Strain SAG 11-48b" /LENGTH=240 /DNA_ID=CAMNT_0049587761 /DNA_START=187 /DNA_END=912 /DNA_ORIENTATION=+